MPYSTVWPPLRFDVVLCITGVTDVGHPGGRVEASCASIDPEILELWTRKCGVWFMKSFIRRGGSTCSNSTCYIIIL